MFIREFKSFVIFYWMINENCFKLWGANRQPAGSTAYRPHDRIRKSLDNSKKLKSDLFRMRTSLSTTSLSYLNFTSALKKNSSASLLVPRKSAQPQKSGKSTIKMKLEQIQKKLKDARMPSEAEHEHSDVKTTLDTMQSIGEATSRDTKESMFESQQLKEKNRLSHYTTTISKPQNIRPISHNPYSLKSKYYLAECMRAVNQKPSLAIEHVSQSIQMLLQYRLCKLNQQTLFEDEPKIQLPPVQGGQNKKTLILDLDETLIHCFQKSESAPADLNLTINIDGFPFEVGINIRPYAISFLRRMKKRWEIIVFTASHQSYADAILNEVDPEGVLVDHRLYRQHCRELTTDFFIKDLSKINRDLSKTVLVDNSAYSYAMQPDNGIPILPFYEGRDFELSALEHYLNRLSDCEDVREINRQYFQLHKYTSYDNASNLVRELYCSKGQ